MEGIVPVDLLIHILNIIVLFIVLRVILWKPITKYLSARAERVQDELETARKTREEAEQMKTEYQREVGDLEARGREIMRDAQMHAGEQAKELLRLAKEQSDALINDSRERIETEKAQAVVSARQEIAQLAADMASRILKREVKPEDNVSAAQSFFDEVQ
ncbi:MAG: F0F1 ATP synthase subunit B [Oscillospiraceae bacterium]|jgi:F-type H+-transporting ATPase subunit b|nr:F0F1 ATP synthase subunit B [Oscillospiraceae bacterium]